MSAEFVHLHNHSEYSLLDGACKLGELISRTKELGMNAVALTDHGALFGAMEFYFAARKAEIKPIIGCEMYICADRKEKNAAAGKWGDYASHLLLLAKNETGYRNLVKLSSIGYTEGFYYRPRIDHEMLIKHAEGLIATSGCLAAEIPSLLLNDDEEGAMKKAGWYRDLFGDDFYMELQWHNLAEDQKVFGRLQNLARKLGTKLVGTNDTHYLKREHAEAHDALLCVGTGSNVADEHRLRFETEEFYLKTPAEMCQLFDSCPEAAQSTLEIAEKCDLQLDFKTRHLPKFPLPDGEENEMSYLTKLSRVGLNRRYPSADERIEERFRFELAMIERMGFAGYFLIVSDFIRYARSVGVAVGPGRGSAAGSLICYCLGITDLDPLRFELYFERFLNPERISMPDIDIDFQDEGRGQIIEYVKAKYGAESVTQIITFGRLKARAVVRDVGRVLGLGYGDVDRLAKKIPEGLNVRLAVPEGSNARGARQDNPELEAVLTEREDFRKIFAIGEVLEGTCRHASTHAAGVVITPGPLTDYVPLYRQSDGSITTQFDMNIVDKIGLLKMDFLGLRTLSVIARCLDMLKARDVRIDLGEITEQHDDATYKLLSDGDTIGVFQLESRGMREWLCKLKPSCLDDIVAMVALYRPGPMDMIGDFIKRKHGQEKITYLHPKLEPILRSTYGIAVYQEQVLAIARDCAGFSLGRADILRRAMGKKDPKELARMKAEFLEGCKQFSKMGESQATQLFDQVEKFAGYGFNKAHAACYGVLAYQTAYLKANYTAEFMAAEMSSWHGETRVMPKLINECRSFGVTILPPDVNSSDRYFTVDEGRIRCGLEAVKNVGGGAIASIIEARSAGGPFASMFDFASRVDVKHVNRKAMESLIGAGALDSLGGHRAQYMAALDQFFAYAAQSGRERDLGQSSLFGGGGDSQAMREPALPNIPPYSADQKLSLEKDLIGFYVSGHPLDDVREEVSKLATATLGDTSELTDQQMVRLAGVVTEIRRSQTRKGKAMASVTLEDFTGSGELLVFADALDNYGQTLRKEAKLVFHAKVSCREDEDPKFITQEIFSIEAARAEFARSLWITVQDSGLNESTMDALEDLFLRHTGNVPVYFKVQQKGETRIIQSRRYRLKTSLDVLKQVQDMLGQSQVKVG